MMCHHGEKSFVLFAFRLEKSPKIVEILGLFFVLMTMNDMDK
jgi:hypothetical protein